MHRPPLSRTLVNRSLAFFFCSLFFLVSCDELSVNGPWDDFDIDDSESTDIWLDLPDQAFNYSNIQLPPYFNAPPVREADNTPNNNLITNEGATLGRVLFYDTQLSLNNTISCASCHVQEKAFTDPEKFSIGFEGGLTGRNSMSLANAKYYENGHFFWDERANTLEDQTLMPIQDHVEMGMTLDSLEKRLQNIGYYRNLFTQAFGDETVTRERISLALSQFVRSMVSYQSKYDQALGNTQGPPNPNMPLAGLTAEENLGRQIFIAANRGGCAGCHTTDLQIGRVAQNNGLDVQYADQGLGDVTGDPRDNGKFKVPSLRNVDLTGPYMHDGRFESLMQVVEHYNSGVQPHQNLDNRLRLPGSNMPRRLNLTQAEKEALVAFMRTLTDETFISDEKFSDPFRY